MRKPSGSRARHARRTGAATEAHDRQPSRSVRIRQPQAAHDARGRAPAPPGQPRRQDPLVRPVDARRSERRKRLDQLSPRPGSQAVQGRARKSAAAEPARQ